MQPFCHCTSIPAARYFLALNKDWGSLQVTRLHIICPPDSCMVREGLCGVLGETVLSL